MMTVQRSASTGAVERFLSGAESGRLSDDVAVDARGGPWNADLIDQIERTSA